MKNSTSVRESDSEESHVFPENIEHLDTLWNLLVLSSVGLLVFTAFLRLDILPSTLLGTGVVGFNFYWTRRIAAKLFHVASNIKRRMLFIYFFKFGLSVVILFSAIVYFRMSALGLLLGLSNIVVAVFLYSIKSVLFP
ncbi:ATP synthase subunit I [Deltaproteobacteria bacterium TL4]